MAVSGLREKELRITMEHGTEAEREQIEEEREETQEEEIDFHMREEDGEEVCVHEIVAIRKPTTTIKVTIRRWIKDSTVNELIVTKQILCL